MVHKAAYYSTTSLTAFMLGMMLCSSAIAAPEGGVVAAGGASISSPNAGHVVIEQHTDKAVINWQNFDHGAADRTEFRQPSQGSATLNRINGTSPTHINGSVAANGTIVIVNPNGVVFGEQSQLDVGGLVASTADVSDEHFMQGILGFDRPGNPDAAIVNHGTITAKEAGLVGLVAPNVENHGVITANMGRVHLASGDTATVDLHGDGLIQMAVSDNVSSQLVINTGDIRADGGTIALTAAAGRDIVNSLIHVEGELSAPSIAQRDGKIIIAAEGRNAVRDNNASLKNTKNGNSFVSTSHAFIDVSGRASNVRGGSISITADQIAIGADTLMDASGSAPLPVPKPDIVQHATSTLTAQKEVKSEVEFLNSNTRGGGSIKIGGDYLGTGQTPAAENVYVDSNTLIANEGLTHGDGGRTIIWADNNTGFYGNVFARGGDDSGHGGFLETSGKQFLDAQGYADLTASEGYQRGLYLLDPDNITIYGNVDPRFVATDSSINLDENLQLWLDASDPESVELTYSTNGVATTVVGDTSGTNIINTTADVSANLEVGARIRLGSAGTVTTADVQGADTYTVTAISGTEITVAETITTDYSGQSIHQGLVSLWNDKSRNQSSATHTVDRIRPLWLDSRVNNNSALSFSGEKYLVLDSFIFSNNDGLSSSATLLPDVNSTGTTKLWLDFGHLASEGYGAGLSADTVQAHSSTDHGGTTTLASNPHGSSPIIQSNIIKFEDEQQIFLNGNLEDSDPIMLRRLTTNEINESRSLSRGNAGPLVIGAQAKQLGRPRSRADRNFDGLVGDVLIYDTALSKNARHLLDQYQSAKWDIELNNGGSGATEVAHATAADGYSVFSTRYLERLSQTADVSLLADNNITLDLQGDTLDLANNRSLSLNAVNQDITNISGGTIQARGTGNITFNAGRDIDIDHGFTLNTLGDGNINLDAGNNINTTNNARFITHNIGNISLNAGSSINISDNSLLTTLGSGTIAAIAQNNITASTVTFTTNNNDIILNSDSDASQAGTIRLSNSMLESNGGNITLGGGANPLVDYAYGTTTQAQGIQLNRTTINAQSGTVTLNGHGDVSSSVAGSKIGVRLLNQSSLQTGDNGSVNIRAKGGNSAGNANRGIQFINESNINALGDATVSINAQGGDSDRISEGLRLDNNSYISSYDGDITVTSKAGNATTQSDRGLTLNSGSSIRSNHNGNISLTGQGGNTGNNSQAILLLNGSSVTATHGNIELSGITSSTSNGFEAGGANNRLGGTAMTGNITFNTDAIDLANDSVLHIDTTGDIYIAPRTVGTHINLGSASSGLALTQTELNTIKSADNIIIGDAVRTDIVTVSDMLDTSSLNTNLSILGNSIDINDAISTHHAHDLSIMANNGNIVHNSGILTANNIRFDATGSIVAHVDATNVDIANNATSATLTGIVAGGQTQAEADLITGGPGNDANYTFEEFTIRAVAPPIPAAAPASPSPITPNIATNTIPTSPNTPTLPSSEIASQPIPTVITDPQTPTPPPATSNSVVEIPDTVKIVSQETPLSSQNNTIIYKTENTSSHAATNKPIIYVEHENASQQNIRGKVSIKKALVKRLRLTDFSLFGK